MAVGLVVVTYNRPSFCERAIKSVAKHLNDVVDYVVLVNDGSDSKFNGEYARVNKALESVSGTSILHNTNEGVGSAKNSGLYYLMKETDSEWLFVMEDDLRVLAPEAVTQYIAIAERHGLGHLSFAHHGPGNVGGPIDTDGDVEFYPHSIGAWCLYSRECLEAVGGFDENFHNAWEHVELTLRLAAAGYTSGAYRYADALGSWIWLREIQGSIERSSIPVGPGRQIAIRNGLIYWRDAKPETYEMLFGPSMPLHAYAQGIIGAQ